MRIDKRQGQCRCRPLVRCCATTVALLLLEMLMSMPHAEAADRYDVNYDEAKVPTFTLPNPLVNDDGSKVTSPDEWMKHRRPEILRLFCENVYGYPLPKPSKPSVTVEETKDALDGLAVKKAIRIAFTDEKNGPAMTLHAYLPANAKGPVPMFVGIHLFDTSAPVPMPGGRVVGDNKPLPSGIDPQLMPGPATINRILERGYGIATINPEDIAPDDPDTYLHGAITLSRPAGKTERDATESGALGAWAWALSRALDYFETDPEIDETKTIAIGHSRRGKAALWAGATDPRFAAIISNESGCGGAALSRRQFGETVEMINDRFPHWFCLNFRKFNDREQDLPVDQHELIALIAPRPVHVGSAEDDRWADPHGEFLSALDADPVYRLLGTDGIAGVREMPPPNQTVGHTIAYHVRSGQHSLSDFDWMLYLDWIDNVLPRTK